MWVINIELNPDQTGVITLSPKHLRDILSTDVALLSGIDRAPSTTVRKLGDLFNQDLTLHTYIKYVSSSTFYHLQNVLSQSAERLVHPFIFARKKS